MRYSGGRGRLTGQIAGLGHHGRLCRVRMPLGGFAGAETGQPDVRAGGGRAAGRDDGLAGSARQGQRAAGAEGLDQRRVGRRGHVRRAVAKVFGAEVTGVCSTPDVNMVRSIGAGQGYRLHPAGLHQERAALRSHPRQRGSFAAGPQARARPQGDPRRHRRIGRSLDRWPGPREQGARVVTVREPETAPVPYRDWHVAGTVIARYEAGTGNATRLLVVSVS